MTDGSAVAVQVRWGGKARKRQFCFSCRQDFFKTRGGGFADTRTEPCLKEETTAIDFIQKWLPKTFWWGEARELGLVKQ
jgi:hypothetical protein